MKNGDLKKDVIWLKWIVIVAGILLEVSGISAIAMYLQVGASITIPFDVTISGLVIGIIFILSGLSIQVASILKLRTPSEHVAKSKPDRSVDRLPTQKELSGQPSTLKKTPHDGKLNKSIKLVPLAAIMIMLVLGLGFAMYWFLEWPASSIQPVAYSTDEEIKDTAKEISDRVSLISLIEGGVTLEGDEKLRAQYTININAKYGDEYFFNIYEYWIQTGGDVSQIPTAKICSTIDEFFNRKDKVLEALQKLRIKGNVSFPLWVVNAGIEADNIQAVIVEFLYALRKFYELKTKRVEILIKGYADGWKKPWKRPLKPGRYYFDEIIVYPAVHPDSMNPVEYFRTEAPIRILSQYENQHLPDLRANFVKVDLVEPFLAQCKDVKNKEVHILKGYEFNRDDIDPLKRKAQVFVNIY